MALLEDLKNKTVFLHQKDQVMFKIPEINKDPGNKIFNETVLKKTLEIFSVFYYEYLYSFLMRII